MPAAGLDRGAVLSGPHCDHTFRGRARLNLLARIGPAILWIGALLASLLGLDRLFQADREDGSLDLMILSADRHMPALTVFVKCLAHWTASVLPLVVAAPLLGLFMNIGPPASARRR